MIKLHAFLAGIANVTLIDDGRGVVVVDTGMKGSAPQILRRVARLGYGPRDVRLILLTHVHVDHAGSAAELRRLTGAPVALHAADVHLARAGKHKMPIGRGWAGVSSKWLVERTGIELSYEAFTPDLFISEGRSLTPFGLEACVLHTPGHTLGSISVQLEDRSVIIGDALINLFRVGFPMYWEEPEMARESARRIQGLRPGVLFSGHGKPFGGQELDNYLERYAAKKRR